MASPSSFRQVAFTGRPTASRGFTLIEVMVVVVIVGILAAVALPSYRSHLVKSGRSQAQTELMQLASQQEKIYLNSNNYSGSVTGAYTGNATGGLGRTTGTTTDGTYSISVTVPAGSQSFVLTATPLEGTRQAGDGALTITETGKKQWLKPSGTVNW